MGKTRFKEGKELEYFQGLVRELKSEIKHLRKRLARYENPDGSLKIKDDGIDDPDIPAKKLIDLCPNCKKHKTVTTDVGIRIITTCSSCGYRRSVKK